MKEETIYKEELEMYNREAPKIQAKFDFEVPAYILHEMITNSFNKENIICLVNLAMMNGRILETNANVLKKYVINEF